MPRKGENIYKRKDGRWEGRFIKGRTSDGKAIYGYLYSKTYRDLKNKLQMAKINAANGDNKKHIEDQNILFSVIVNDWLSSMQANVKESTYIKYKNVVNLYVNPIFGSLGLDMLTEDVLREGFCRMLTSGGRNNQGLSPKTVSDVLSVVRSILRYAGSKGYRPLSMAKEISIKQKSHEIVSLTASEQDRLCRYIEGNISLRNLGVLLCLYTGIRIGELCALQWDDISLVDNTIHIHQTMQRLQSSNQNGKKTEVVVSTPKSECSIRLIPLPDDMASIISASVPVKKGFFLTSDECRFIEPRTMQNHFKRILSRANVPPANFHILRHTFATRCVESEFDIKSLSEILGHSNVNITMNRYVHPTLELKRHNMQKLSLPFAVK